ARPRGELRGERDRRTAVVAFYRRGDTRSVLLEVLESEDTAHRADVLRDGGGDFAFVEVAAPGAREPSQRLGESRELDPAERRVRRRDGRHPRLEPDVAGRAVARLLARQVRDLEHKL